MVARKVDGDYVVVVYSTEHRAAVADVRADEFVRSVNYRNAGRAGEDAVDLLVVDELLVGEEEGVDDDFVDVGGVVEEVVFFEVGAEFFGEEFFYEGGDVVAFDAVAVAD